MAPRATLNEVQHEPNPPLFRINATSEKSALESPTGNLAKRDADFIAAARTLLPDLANRLEAANRKSEWRPISEAPKDGTSILTFPHYHITHWDMEIESFTHGLDEDAERFKPMRWMPTHFMPLPEPPTKPTP